MFRLLLKLKAIIVISVYMIFELPDRLKKLRRFFCNFLRKGNKMFRNGKNKKGYHSEGLSVAKSTQEENKQPLLRLFVDEGRRLFNEGTSDNEVIEFSRRVTEASVCAQQEESHVTSVEPVVNGEAESKARHALMRSLRPLAYGSRLKMTLSVLTLAAVLSTGMFSESWGEY